MNFANRGHERNRALCIAKGIWGNERGFHPLACPQLLQGSPHGLGAPSQLPTYGNFLETKHSNINILKKYLILSLIEGYGPFLLSQ